MNHYLHSVVSLHRTISFMHNAQHSNVHNCITSVRKLHTRTHK